MMLATRCPYCRTTFRVVQDQLKICNGIVRCGSCRQVFNGIEQLQSADAALNEAARAQAQAHVEAQNDLTWPQSAQTDINPVTIVAEDDDKVDFTEANDDLKLILTPSEDLPESVHTALAETPTPAFSDGRDTEPAQQSDDEIDPDLALHMDDRGDFNLAEEIRHDDQPHPERESDQDPHFVPTALSGISGASIASASTDNRNTPTTATSFEPSRAFSLPDEDDDDPAYKVELRTTLAEPAFVQRARRNERWGRTTRIVTILLVLGLIPALLLQSIDAFHQRIAATFPVLSQTLEQVCAVIDCQTDLPAQIEAVSIDASELHAPKNSDKTFALNLVLRNRSALAQAWPYIELTLNDANDQPVVRRVLKSPEYLTDKPDPSQGFAAHSERSVSLVFEVDQLKPVGYRVYLFYP